MRDILDRKDPLYNECVLLSIIFFSNEINEKIIEKIFRYVPEKMFIGAGTEIIYKNIKFLCGTEDIKLLGTNHFVTKVALMSEVDFKNASSFMLSLEDYFSPLATLDYWIKNIQDVYFKKRFQNATSKKEFEEINSEIEFYTLQSDMANIHDDSNLILDEYEIRKNTALFTPYQKINSLIGSLQGGDMIVLAGSTGGGKTCFMLNLAVGMAKQGKKVDIFSLEMPRQQLQTRIICSEALIDSKKFRRFSLDDTDREKYNKYINNEFKKLNIRIFKQQTVSIELIRNIEMSSDADIVFIDYLGLINSFGNKNSYDKFSEISRNIKLIAMASNKPIVALHQLNREFQNRDDKTPKVSDLRDSGKIEQDADMIWFVHRPGLFADMNTLTESQQATAQRELKFILAKNRHGETNKTVTLDFDGTYQKIREVANG